MVTTDRSYNLCNCFVVYLEIVWQCFAVYVGIVRRSAETFDIKYDTVSLYFTFFQILKSEYTYQSVSYYIIQTEDIFEEKNRVYENRIEWEK